MIGLPKIDRKTQRLCSVDGSLLRIGKCRGSIYMGLAFTDEVEIRAV